MTIQDYKRLARQQISGRLGTLIAIELIWLLLSLSILFRPIVLLGYYLLYIELAGGRAPRFFDLFSMAEYYGKALCLHLISALLIFAWSLLLIIPGIVKGMAYAMAPYILAEHPHMSVWDALEESENMMRGHKMELFILQLSFFGWYLLSALTFGIGLLFVRTYMQATMAIFYVSLRGPKHNAQSAPIWL